MAGLLVGLRGRPLGRVAGWTYAVAWLGLGLWLLYYLGVYCGFAYSILRFPFDFDQGEGYDVNSAWALVQGLPIYGSPDVYPFYSSNYPPLYTLLLTPAVALLGPRLSMGRLLSLAATAAVALLIGWVVRRHTKRWLPALAAGLLFLASPYVYHTTALARVNALTLALALAGVVACERAGEGTGRPRAWTVATGALLLAALYTKQTAIDAAAAACLFLALRDRSRGLALAAGLLGAGTALYLAIDLATAGGFTLNLVWANANPFTLAQALTYYGNFVETHLLLLAGAAGFVVASLRRGGWRGLPVYAWYFLFGLLTAAGTGKWGAGESYFLPAIASTCLLCGLGLGRLEVALSRLRPASALAATLALALAGGWQLLLLWHGPLAFPQWGAYDRGPQAGTLSAAPTAADTAAAWGLVDKYIRKTTGNVLVEESAFLLVDGRRVLGNATQQRNLYEAGRHDPAALVGLLERREIALVILNGQQYPAPVLRAIGRNYYAIDTVEVRGSHFLILIPGGR